MTGLRLRGQAQRHPLALLVAAALIVRLATLTWGIGLGRFSGWYHPDESKAWSSVVGFPGNYLTNRNFLYGTALQYMVVWPDSLASFWYRYQVPAPEDFRFYARLLEGRSGYVPIGCWRPATPLPPEFSDQSVGLYRRDTLPDASPGPQPATCLGPCPAAVATTCLSRD